MCNIARQLPSIIEIPPKHLLLGGTADVSIAAVFIHNGMKFGIKF